MRIEKLPGSLAAWIQSSRSGFFAARRGGIAPWTQIHAEVTACAATAISGQRFGEAGYRIAPPEACPAPARAVTNVGRGTKTRIKTHGGTTARDGEPRPTGEPQRAQGKTAMSASGHRLQPRALPCERGRRAGGLAVALADAATKGSMWFGWSGRRAEETSEDASSCSAESGVTYATIDIAERDYQRFYNGFANGALWPLLHYRTRPAALPPAPDYEAYRAVNRAFAAGAAAAAAARRPDLDPRLPADDHGRGIAGARAWRNRIGFFLHVPFVPPSFLQVLPPADELVAALSACDVIGFQTRGDADMFLQNVSRIARRAAAAQDGRLFHHGREVRRSPRRSASTP